MNLLPARLLPGVPPGPRWPPLLQTIAFIRWRHRFIPAMHRRYGDTFTLTILPGPRHVVVFSRPADIKEIFSGDPATFHAGEGNRILRPVMGRHSVLLTDDDEHLRARKLLMPAFNGASLRAYTSLVESIAKSAVEEWHDGETLVTLDEMNAITLEVILQVVFGVTDRERLSRMRPMVNAMVAINAALLIGWAYPKVHSHGPWKRYFDNVKDFNTILYDEITARRTSADLEQRTDVLSRLLQVGRDGSEAALTDAELRDQLVTLLLAGHETTASALTWTLHELGLHPAIQTEARAAADAGDDAYLEACLKESMRVHPIIDQVARALTVRSQVAGWSIPAGATVAPSIRLVQAGEDSFEDAATFRPRRFLDDHVAPNTWIPFGGGVRRCIGAGFSLMEGTAILREILTRYSLEVDVPEATMLRNITAVPAGKAPVRLRAR